MTHFHKNNITKINELAYITGNYNEHKKTNQNTSNLPHDTLAVIRHENPELRKKNPFRKLISAVELTNL